MIDGGDVGRGGGGGDRGGAVGKGRIVLQHGRIAGIVESGKEVEGTESPTQESRGVSIELRLSCGVVGVLLCISRKVDKWYTFKPN